MRRCNDHQVEETGPQAADRCVQSVQRAKWEGKGGVVTDQHSSWMGRTGRDSTGHEAWAEYRYVHIGEVRFIRSCKMYLIWSKGGEIFRGATKGGGGKTTRPHQKKKKKKSSSPMPCLFLNPRQTPTRTGPGLGPCHVTLGSPIHRSHPSIKPALIFAPCACACPCLCARHCVCTCGVEGRPRGGKAHAPWGNCASRATEQQASSMCAGGGIMYRRHALRCGCRSL